MWIVIVGVGDGFRRAPALEFCVLIVGAVPSLLERRALAYALMPLSTVKVGELILLILICLMQRTKYCAVKRKEEKENMNMSRHKYNDVR